MGAVDGGGSGEVRNRQVSQAVAAHAFNPSTREAEADGFLRLRPAWPTKFQDSQGYTEKPCLEKPKKKKETGKSAVGHLWIVGMVEEPGESGGLYWGHSRLLRVLSSCPNLYHCMVIEELGSSPRHMVKFPRFFLHSSGNFHKSQKCSRV